MRSWRVLGFILAIVLGLAIGLLAGWRLFPPSGVITTPASLRADYKADYVLMTAEIFSKDGDLAAAEARLTQLGNTPMQVVQQAIITAQELGYGQADMQLLARFFSGMQTYTPMPQVTQP